MYVCQTAVDALADSSKFPDEWMFKHRWAKGKKDAPTKLPSGEKITFLTVGGRTSCVVPSVQKKTGPVAGDLKAEGKNDESGSKTNGKASRKRKASEEDSADSEPESKASKKVNGKTRGKKSEAAAIKAEEEEVPKAKAKKQKAIPDSTKVKIDEPVEVDSKTTSSRRRSARNTQK
jgi:formamidopyrimidine-DNA glycosylase